MASVAPKETEFSIDKNKLMDSIEQFILKYGSEHQEYLKTLLLNFINRTKIRPIDPEKILAQKVDTIIRFQDAAAELQLPLCFRATTILQPDEVAPKMVVLYRAWNGYIFVDANHITVSEPYWAGKEYGAVATAVKKRVHFKDENANGGSEAGASMTVESAEEEFARLKREIKSMCAKNGKAPKA